MENKEKKDQLNKKELKVVITTSETIVTGKIQVPPEYRSEKSTPEGLFLNILNGGNRFIEVRDVTVINRKELEYTPHDLKSHIINIDTIQSCRIDKS